MAKNKLTKAEKALVGIPLCVLLLACVAVNGRFSYWWKTHNPLSDEMQRTAYQLAGENAVDCGWAQTGDSLTPEYKEAGACAANAFKAGKPFHVRCDFFARWGSDPSYSIVQTPQKQVYELSMQTSTHNSTPLVKKLLRHPHLRGEGGFTDIEGD